METQTNTGLGLIKTTIERVENQKSLFKSALKKLVNSSEKELSDFLGRQFFLIHPIKSIKDAIKKVKYDWVYDYILKGEENQKLVKQLEKASVSKEVETELVHFNKSISTENALKELDRMGMRPATEVELLAFGVEYPEEQRKYPIVALPSQEQINNDSVFRDEGGIRCALCLFRHGAERRLDLVWLEGAWHGRWRFLAVRK